MAERTRVLLLGSNERSALSIARSLGQAGMRVEIVRFDRWRHPAEFSRYCHASHFLGQPHHDFNGYADRFLSLVRAKAYQVVFPINDISNEIIYGCRADLPRDVAVIGPAPEAYRSASDKATALQLAKEIGIQAPESLLLQTHRDREHDAMERLGFPVFVKPTRSAWLQDNFINVFEVRKCVNREQVIAKLTEDLPRAPVLLQREVSGPGVGINFCAAEGRLLAVTMTLRLHEPPQGGGSSYRCNLPVPDHLLAAMEKLAARLRWSGLMMVELKRHGDQFVIMEMNCRPWGSMETAIKAGVDFPRIAVEAALGQCAPRPLIRSDRPVRVRNLKSDVGWVLKRRGQWLRRPSSLLAWLRSFRDAFSGTESFDLEQRGDLRPALMQFNHNVMAILGKVSLAQRMVVARLRYRYRPVAIHAATRILFLCRGNINRSAVAERVLRAYGFRNVQSAGTLLAQGRGISAPAARFLGELGLDGAVHRSTCVWSMRRELGAFDPIVVFDFRTWAEFAGDFPEHAGRLVLFEQLAGRRLGELQDPHGQGEEIYQQCFERIQGGLSALGPGRDA